MMAPDNIERRDEALRDLRQLTEARVMLGRHGAGLPTHAAQAFLLDHARARQAVWSEIDRNALRRELADLPLDMIDIDSAATSRDVYVRRPDLGRQVSAESLGVLQSLPRACDIVILVGDGLSASAVAINAAPLVRAIHRRLTERGLTFAPVILAANARVALSDPIGETLAARIAIMLIGERPGLSAADSLGAYVTYGPSTGTPDSRRNCISNIRDGGLSIEAACDAIVRLVTAMLQAKVSGVALGNAVATRGPAKRF